MSPFLHRTACVACLVLSALLFLSGRGTGARADGDAPGWDFETAWTSGLGAGCTSTVRINGLGHDKDNRPIVGWTEENGCGGDGPAAYWARRTAAFSSPPSAGTWTLKPIQAGERGGGVQGEASLVVREDGTPYFTYGTNATVDVQGAPAIAVYRANLTTQPTGPGLEILQLGYFGCNTPAVRSVFAGGEPQPRFLVAVPGCAEGQASLAVDGVTIKGQFLHDTMGKGTASRVDAPAYGTMPTGEKVILYSRGADLVFSDGVEKHETPIPGALTNVTASSIAVSFQGVIHAAVIGSSAAEQNVLQYLTSEDGGAHWTVQPVDTGFCRMVSIAVDGDGNPAIAYWQADARLRFATPRNGAWHAVTVKTLASNSQAKSLQLTYDGTGAAVLAYVDVSARAVVIARHPNVTAPTVENGEVTPASADLLGQDVTLRADVFDNIGLSTVSGEVQLPDGSTASVAMARVPNTEAAYRGVYHVPAAATDSPVVYRFFVKATNTLGGATTEEIGTVSQLGRDHEKPSVTSALMSPTLIPQTGGTVTISAIVTDNHRIDSVVATVQRSDGSPFQVTLPQKPGSQSVYESTFNAPANRTLVSRTYTAQVTAKDPTGNSATADTNRVEVPGNPDHEAPTISKLRVTPKAPTTAKVTLRISATVTDNAGPQGLESVIAVVQPAGGAADRKPMTAGAGGSYTLTTLVENKTTKTKVFKVQVEARDFSGNLRTSETVTLKVPGLPPAPLAIGAVPVRVGGKMAAKFMWRFPNGVAITRFVITRISFLEGEPEKSFTAAPRARSLTDTSVLPGHSYGYTVTAVAPAGSNRSVNGSLVTIPGGTLAVTDPDSGDPVPGATVTLDFGPVAVGQSVEKSVEFANTSTKSALSLDPRPSLSGPLELLTQLTVLDPVAPGSNSSVALTVRFSPTGTGSVSGKVEVRTSDPKRPVITVQVKGEGVAGP